MMATTTKPRVNAVITWDNPDDGPILIGRVSGCPDIVVDTRLINPINLVRFTKHGIKQRCGDGGALSRDTKTGRPASPADKHAAIARVAAHYLSGTEAWEMTRAAPVPALDGTILAAVAEGIGRSTDEVRAMVYAGAGKHGVKPADYLARLATADKVKPILERMRAEAVTVDANDELEAMMTPPSEEGGDDEAPDVPDVPASV